MITEVSNDKEQQKYLLSCTSNKETGNLEFCARGPANDVCYCEMNPSQLSATARIKGSAQDFFASMRNSFRHGLVSGEASRFGLVVTIPVDMETNTVRESRFVVSLTSSTQDHVHRLLINPLLDYYFSVKANPAEDEKYRSKEQAAVGMQARQAIALKEYEAMIVEVEGLRNKSEDALSMCKAAKDKCDQLSSQVRRIKYPKMSTTYLYGDDHLPQRNPLHTPYAPGHTPAFIEYSKAATELIKYAYRDAVYDEKGIPRETSSKDNPGAVTGIRAAAPRNVKDPNIQQMLEGAPDESHEDILKCMEKIDEWDLDVFALQEHSRGGSLFMVSYCLFYKYGLVQHYGIDPEVLLNWCSSVQAGYHPNAYHNSTHAADVTQILHYILFPGGMHRVVKISPEDAFASIISGTIHDFDHPGFNNNFHVRTNAYLALLYNDRSVLENHHCASVFELMKNPKFNLLQSLSTEQRKEVRDTTLEMVLSTDMGNHNKIFHTFRKRLHDDGEWIHREDIRLALSIAIKMADISNCSRPQNLYLQWAKKIADEFYNQGDVERKMHYTVSPFMDRTTHKTDFPKGQMSFMNYVVIPLFEAGAEFCPQLQWTVQKIQDNKEYWQRQEDNG